MGQTRVSARLTTAIPRADTWVRPYRLRATVQEEHVKTFSWMVACVHILYHSLGID
jgi:hypothetical protein